MKGLRTRFRRHPAAFCAAAAIVLSAGTAILVLKPEMQGGGNPVDTHVKPVPATESSVIRRLDRNLLRGSRAHTGVNRTALARAFKKTVGVPTAQQEETGKGEVVTLPIMKGDMEEREVRRLFVPLRDDDEVSFLAAIQEMMRKGDSQSRLNVLKTIGTVYSGESAAAEAEEGDDAALSAEAKRIRAIVAVIRDGLNDAEADVRAMAVKTARRIDGEASGVAMSQIMNGNDVEMKLLLLAETSGKATDADMTVSLMGMAAPEESVQAAAAENLRGLTGRSFESYDDACAWWEENHIDFLNKAAGISPDANVAEAVGEVGADPADGEATTVSSENDASKTNKERKK